MLPPFYKLGTFSDMSRMARKLALARKAIVEIRRLEDNLEELQGSITEGELKTQAKQINDYSLIMANLVKEAIEILTVVKSKIGSYRERVQDAVD